MGSFPIDLAQIVGLFMEAVLYGQFCSSAWILVAHTGGTGIFLVTFFSCLRVLCFVNGRSRSIHSIKYIMTTAALLMFVFATLDLAVGLQLIIEAFFRGDGPIAVFNSTGRLNVVKMVCYIVQTCIADAILVSFSRAISTSLKY